MRKWLTGTLCALTIAASSCFGGGDKEKEDNTPIYRAKTTTSEGYRIILEKRKDVLTVNIKDTKGSKDWLYLVDNDFSKGNGLEEFRNFTRDLSCYKGKELKKGEKPKKNICSQEEMKKANDLYKWALDQLGYDMQLKPKKGITGGW